MNSKISLQLFKIFFFAQSLLIIFLAAPGMVAAAGTGSATPDDIKVTNYSVPAGAYFVSPDGKETNSGKSYDSPWSVAKAIKLASDGATIVFKGGTYRNVNFVINKKLTLQAYPQEKPLLKGSVDVEGWVADGDKWRKDNWNYSFPSNVARVYIDPKTNRMAGHRDMVYVNGERLQQVGSKIQVGPGKFYVDSANNKLYIGTNPIGKTVEATTQSQGFAMSKKGLSNPSGTVVRGLGFAHYADQALFIGAPYINIEDNTFVWNGQQGVKFWAANANVITDGIVRGNTFSYNGRKGLGGNQTHRLLIEGNTVSYNNVENFSKTYDAAGIKFTRSEGMVLRDNLVENNSASGIWLDVSSTNATIADNIVRNNEWMGIMFEISHKAIIAANVIYNNPTGIYVLESSHARVYNNTLSKNGKNFRVMDGPRYNPDSKQRAAGITWNAYKNTVKNNIFSHTKSGNSFEASNISVCLPSSIMIDAVNYNGYYRKLSEKRSIVKWSHGPGKCSTGYPSIAAFRSATGLEPDALVVDNVTTNPFFIDEENENFYLKPGSPAIGRGQVLPADIASILKVAPGEPVDLGALQSKVFLSQ